jgi:hypothetical protein
MLIRIPFCGELYLGPCGVSLGGFVTWSSRREIQARRRQLIQETAWELHERSPALR